MTFIADARSGGPRLAGEDSRDIGGSCPLESGCGNATHTLSAVAVFGGKGGAHGAAGVTAVTSGHPTDVITATATETGSYCDPFFGDPAAPECQGSYSGIATCPVLGTLNEAALTTILPHISIRLTVATYKLLTVNENGTASFVLSCPNGNQNATCGTANYLGSQPTLWAEEYNFYVTLNSVGFCASPINLIQYLNGPPAPKNCQ